MRRRFVGVGLAVGVVMASMLALAPAASAGTIEKHGYVRDSGCYGRIIDSKSIVGDFRTLGRVELWYSSRNGGENCVITRSSVGRAEMLAALDLDMDGNKRWSSPPDVYSSDYGIYDRYAGGAYRSHADGRCVRFHGIIWWGGDSGSYDSAFGHCS